MANIILNLHNIKLQLSANQPKGTTVKLVF